MEPSKQSPVKGGKGAPGPEAAKPAVLSSLVCPFLPDAAEIESEPIPRAAGQVLYLLAALIVGALGWAIFAEVDRIVVARGKLVTSTGPIVLQPLETAVVRSIDVREGRLVKRGERLGTFDPTFTTADVSSLSRRLVSLNAQIARLEAELAERPLEPATHAEEALQEQLYQSRQGYHAARLAQYEETAARLRVTLQAAREDIRSLTERAANLQGIVTMHEAALKQTGGARIRVLESIETLLNVRQQLQQAENRVEETNRNLAALAAEREGFMREWMQKAAEELVVARRERNTAADELGKAERKRELVTLVAPTDAVVLEVAKRSVGSVVREAEPMFTLVPLDTPLEAEVEVDTADIGLLRTGDRGRIKLDTFPFQKHGTLEATLRTFSQDAFPRSQPQAAVKGEAFYLGRLVLGPMTLVKVPANTHLLPGMALTAEIMVGRRTVISYLLYPLIRMLDESMREP